MPKTTKRSDVDSAIRDIVSRAAHEIVSAVRADVSAQVSALVGGKPAGRTAARTATKAPRAKAAAFHRRSPAEIAADNEKLLAFIKDHPDLRSEDIQKGVSLSRKDVTTGLVALRESGRIKMNGVKRAATYSVA